MYNTTTSPLPFETMVAATIKEEAPPRRRLARRQRQQSSCVALMSGSGSGSDFFGSCGSTDSESSRSFFDSINGSGSFGSSAEELSRSPERTELSSSSRTTSRRTRRSRQHADCRTIRAWQDISQKESLPPMAIATVQVTSPTICGNKKSVSSVQRLPTKPKTSLAIGSSLRKLSRVSQTVQ